MIREKVLSITEQEMREYAESESREMELEKSDFDDEPVREKDWLDHVSTKNFSNPIFLEYAQVENLMVKT